MLEFLKIMLEGKKSEMDERGATGVEYGLLVALIAAVIIVVVASVGQKVLAAFNIIDGELA
jgi:pilus assembly protein Flp/PilA